MGSRSIGAVDVDMVRSTTDAFDMLDGKFGGGHARRALIQYLHTDVRPMLDGTYSADVGKRAYAAVAEALRLAAWMSYDSGLHGVAQRYFIQALRMAQAAGDRLLGGSVLSAMSHQATFVGRYREAATLARAAFTGPSGSLTPTTAAQYRAMEARALARLGDARGCDLALAEAERQLSKRTEGSDPAYISYFDEVELAAEFGHCFRDLERSVQATERGASGIFGDGLNNRSDFFVTMVQADAYISQGEAGRAFEIALDGLRLGEGLRSARCVQYVREFQGRVTSGMRRSSEFHEFSEQARELRIWEAVNTQP
ncbi:regulator [Streptomyces sp. NPDC102360]|uniref:regulator n=1 Tax=Streptomyces sp. NPDC102360 TaxID=3366160 RepID=UPI0038136108